MLAYVFLSSIAREEAPQTCGDFHRYLACTYSGVREKAKQPGGKSMATDMARQDHLHSEGRVAKTIEDQTAKLPSDTFLWMAIGAMAASATFQMMGNKHVSLFVGQWAPTFLILGVYNKLVKQLGSDRTENAI
jgi:hypothetical protein